MEKENFINYCKGKIFDLQNTTITTEHNEKTKTKILMIGNIRNFGTCKILYNEDYNFLAIDKANKIVCNTTMTTPLVYALQLNFEQIDKQFYNDIITYWEAIKEQGE